MIMLANHPTIVDPAADFFPKGTSVDSWYISSSFKEEDGHQLNCFVHLMTFHAGDDDQQLARITLGITDSVTGVVKTFIKVYPISDVSITKSGDNIDIRMPGAK